MSYVREKLPRRKEETEKIVDLTGNIPLKLATTVAFFKKNYIMTFAQY